MSTLADHRWWHRLLAGRTDTGWYRHANGVLLGRSYRCNWCNADYWQWPV